jgi:hypothetical protein
VYANSCWPVDDVPAVTPHISASRYELHRGSTRKWQLHTSFQSFAAPVTSMDRPPCSGGQCCRGLTNTPRFSVRPCSLPRRCPSATTGTDHLRVECHKLPADHVEARHLLQQLQSAPCRASRASSAMTLDPKMRRSSSSPFRSFVLTASSGGLSSAAAFAAVLRICMGINCTIY